MRAHIIVQSFPISNFTNVKYSNASHFPSVKMRALAGPVAHQMAWWSWSRRLLRLPDQQGKVTGSGRTKICGSARRNVKFHPIPNLDGKFGATWARWGLLCWQDRKIVVSRAGEEFDVRVGGPNRKSLFD